MDNRNRNIVIVLVSLSVVIILVLCYFLFFTKNEVVEEDYPKVNLYKYEIASNKYKYYLDKIDANKIALKETINYRCINEDCSYAKPLFAEGNIHDDLVLIKDESLIVYDYVKKEKITISDITDFEYANFIDGGKYILISMNDKYYIYNIDELKMSNPFKSDFIVTKDDKVFTLLDKYIVNYDGKYGIINMDSGYNVYDNEYDYIDCNNSYCILTTDDQSTIYNISKEEDNVLVQSAKKILYNDDSYIVYETSDSVNLLNLSNEDKKELKLKTGITITKMTYKNSSIIVSFIENNKCYSSNLTDYNKKEAVCETKKLVNDIFADSENKANISIKSNDTKSIDLKIEGTKLYNNTGEYYNYVTVNSDNDDSYKSEEIYNIDSDNAYSFLDKISSKLKLNALERTTFINRWLPTLIKNKKSNVSVLINDDSSNLKGIELLADADSYKGIILIVKKGFKEESKELDELSLDPINRKGFTLISLSGINK